MKTFLKSIFLMAMALFATAKPVFAQENEQHQSKHYQFTLEDCIRFAFSNSGSTDYLQIRKYDIATGVNFTDDDIKKYAKVGLIMSLPFIVNVLWMAISFVSCAALGLIAGFFPALKASRTDPINALRYE